MKMKYFSLILFAILFAFEVRAAEKHDYSYITLGTDHIVVLYLVEKQIAEMHNSTSAEFCNKKSEFVCFEHSSIWFAAPKNRKLDIGVSWTYNNRYCEVIQFAKFIELLSLDKPLYTIHCFTGRKVDYNELAGTFMYSKERGLLYMEFIWPNTGGKSHSYMTTESVGFGSEADW